MKSPDIEACAATAIDISERLPSPLSLRSTHEASGHGVDFGRPLYMVMGLPFDIVDSQQAQARIHAAVASRSRLFMSTPNTNFVVASQRDVAFRNSVLHSDLSLMDGMPLVWVARLMGVPVPERVSGSDMFERLNRPGSPGLSTYFFGGPPGGAAAACAKINQIGGPLRCLGYDDAGFGDIEAMSAESTLARINASGADFLVVALGAGKGQAWIERNLSRLKVPVVSHLGAVVNFVAGSVRRAPVWMRSTGLEWLWRIKEEPKLWRRYAVDALIFGRLVVMCALPYALSERRRSRHAATHGFSHRLRESGTQSVLELTGVLCGPQTPRLGALCAAIASRPEALTIDLAGVTELDSAGVALLALLRAHRLRCGLGAEIRGASVAAKRVLRQCGADWVMSQPAPRS